MRIPSLKQLAPYGVAVLSVALATVVRLEFGPLLGESAPLLLFAIVVILTSWFGGFWPGLLAIILSLLVSDYFFFAPKYSLFTYDSRLDEIRAISFGIFGILFSLIFARLRESIKTEREIRERFRSLVEGVKDYAIFMLDEHGRVASWNPGVERIKGYRASEIVGRDFSVFYTPEDVDSGKPQRVLEIAAAEGRYEESGWQVRRDGSHFWASGVIAAIHDDRSRLRGFTIIMRDVTERKMMEEKVRFFADLNQALLPLADPEDIMAAAARMLGEYLGVDRCAYAEIEANEKYLCITSEYTRGDSSGIVGRFSVDDLGVEALRMMRANRPFVANDVEAAALAGKDLSAYRRAEARALICAPLSKNGHYVARMAVIQKTPRNWEPWEVELVSKVANRCWESVQRARAMRGLRESEERYRAFIANSSEAIWRFELERPIPVNLSEDEQIEMFFKYAYLAECNDAMARMYGYETAGQIVGARVSDLLVRTDPRNIDQLRAFKRSGFNLTDSESHEADRYGNTRYFLNNLTGILDNGAVVRAWGTQRDITEQRRAQQALRESEERLRRISEATQDSIWEINLETNQLWWSERARPLFGTRPGDLQPGLEDWYDRIHPEDAGRVKARFEKFIRGADRNWFDEYRFRRADGSYVHIFDQCQKFYDESGNPILIAGAMSDITDRVLAEEALRASEERYRLLTEISPDGVVIVGDDGTIHLANQSMQRMLGVAPEQVIGRSLFDYFPPRCVDKYRDCLTGLLTSDMPEGQVEIAFRRDDDEVLPAEVSAVRFDWKGRHFAQFIIHDISGRKLDEAERERLHGEIEAERNRLRQILEQMPVGVAIAEAPSGRPIFCNREAESLWRHPMLLSEDYGGYAQYGALREDGSPYAAEEYPIARALISGEAVKGEEMRYRRGDGTETFFSVDSAPIYDSEGRRVSAVATFIDISERKQAEEALRESEERYRGVAEAASDVIVAVGEDGRIQLVNSSVEKVFGYTPSEVVGADLTTLMPEYLRNLHKAGLKRYLETGEKHLKWSGVELRGLHKDGYEVPIEVAFNEYFKDGRRIFTGVIRDITERKQAEEAIRESEERFAKAFRASPDGLVISRISDGVILEVNDSWAELSGYDRDELIGKSTIDLGLYLDPADRRRMLAILKEQNYVRDFEFAIKRKSGESRLITFSAEPLELHGEHCWLTIVRDITERKRADEALRESEERFAKAFLTSPDALVISRLADGLILEANDSFVSLSGYDRDEVIGKSTIDLGIYVDTSDRRRMLAILKERNYVRDFEFMMKRKSGETRLVAFSAEPLELRGEHCWLTVARDITERKRAEEALRESEERFAKAFRASPDGLAITRQSDGVILEVNDSWRQTLGYGSDEVIGKSWAHFDFPIDPVDRRHVRAVLEKQGYIRDFEMAIKRKSGEALIARISIEPIELRGEPCFVTIVHDITQRKRAEEALRESEEQARRQLAYVEAIYATAPVGLCFVDTEMQYLSINERLAEINGCSVEEHLGRTVREVIPRVADTVEPVCRRVIDTGEPALNVEQSAESANEPGAVRHFISSYYPIKNGGGRVLGVNIVVMEITERKKIEEELERLLGQEKAAREEAEAANRMKDEFLATISHELRTPLTSILGWARMLTGGGLTPPQARHALEVIAQSAQSQNRLIEDILDTSRIITGRLKLDAQPVVIENIFHAAVDVIRPSAEAKGIALSEMVDAPDGVVFGDANRLQQALWNLLSNAVKFTNEGGGIEARLGRAEGQIEIAVKDTGIGIDPRFLPHVFDRFRQADASSTREYGGLGIGLAIVRHIVEMHGGSVSASSPGKGRGATFMIRLPLISTLRLAPRSGPRAEAAPPAPAERMDSENGHRLDGVRVLLVEDNPDTLDMLRFIFDEAGAEVIPATSVDDALDALERFRPDALVSDIAMPDRDGYDLIREIRSREPEQGGKIPAVAVTAYARAEDRVRVLAAGFQMHIAKPIDPDELIAVVASLTGNIHY
jgi:PAS domain S-box-containing protein